MIFVGQSAEILAITPDQEYYREYKDSKNNVVNHFTSSTVAREHYYALEHGSITFRLITTRNIVHELIQHRLENYSHDSIRNAIYTGDLVFVKPPWYDSSSEEIKNAFWESLHIAEQHYFRLRQLIRHEYIADIIPGIIKTEIVTTASLREWRNILQRRLYQEDDPQMRELMVLMMKKIIASEVEVLFHDIIEEFLSQFDPSTQRWIFGIFR